MSKLPYSNGHGTKTERINFYRRVWENKSRKQVERELASYQRHLDKHKDTFFQQSAPGEMTDGDRVMVLKEILE